MSAHANVAAVFASLALSCALARPPVPAAPGPDRAEIARERTLELEQVVRETLEMLAEDDPRLLARERPVLPPEVFLGSPLGLFSFEARATRLEVAAGRLAAFGAGYPSVAPPGSAIARPDLERERLSRLLEEERARTADEARLGDASGDLVRGIVATWAPLDAHAAIDDIAALQLRVEELRDRDAWVSAHLREIRDSLRGLPRTGPLDLDHALNPLERMLAPTQYPKSAAAIAELRVALDEDMRAVSPLVDADRVKRGTKLHLGVEVDPATLPARLAPTIARLEQLATAALGWYGYARGSVEDRARELLFVDARCPCGPGTRVGAIGPPPERAKICGVLRALSEEPHPGTAIIALHDEVLLALAAATTSPPPRTLLLCHPDDDAVDAFRREARERPVPFIGVLLAAELLFGPGADTNARLRAWTALGDAPLDIVARELP